MKYIISVCALVSFAASAGTPVSGPLSAVKTLDGKTVYCEKDAHVNGTGYRPSQIMVAPEAEGLRLTFVVNGLVCRKNGGAFQWQPRNIQDDYIYSAMDGRQVTVKTLRSSAVVINREVAVLMKQTLVNQPSQTATAFMNVDKMLNADELAALNSGATVEARLEYFNLILSESYVNGAKVSGGEYAGGSYRYMFTVQKNPVTGALSASEVTVY